MIPAIAAAGLCTLGLLQPFVPGWRRLQPSKQRGTIFSPGNRAPSSHKAKQNYAMSQDNVLGMWSLAVRSQHSHSSRQLRAGEQHEMVERLHPSTSQTPQLCCRKKEWILPTPVLAAPLWPGAVCDPGRTPGLTRQDNSKNYIKSFLNMAVATKDFFPVALWRGKQGRMDLLLFFWWASPWPALLWMRHLQVRGWNSAEAFPKGRVEFINCVAFL